MSTDPNTYGELMRGRGPEHIPLRWLPWYAEAACRDAPDPEVFFPPHSQDPKVQAELDSPGLRICAGCTVQLECRADVDSWEGHDGSGIFGGETEKERRQRRRHERRLAVVRAAE